MSDWDNSYPNYQNGYSNNGYNGYGGYNGYSTGYTNRNYYSYGEPGYSSNFLQTWGFFFAVIGALLIAALVIGWFVYRMFYKDRSSRRQRYAYDIEDLDRKPEYQLKRTEPELKRTRSQLRRTESQRKKEYQLKRSDSQRSGTRSPSNRGGSQQNINESQQKLVGSQQTLSSENQPKLGSQQTLTDSQHKLAGSIQTLPEGPQQQSLTHEKLRQFQAKPPVIVQRARTTEPLQKSNYSIQTEVEQHNGRYGSSTASTPSPGASPSPGATPPTGRFDQRKDRVGIFAGRNAPTTTEPAKSQNSIFSGMTFADGYQKKSTYPSSISPGGTPRAGIVNMSPSTNPKSGTVNGLSSGISTSSGNNPKRGVSPTPSTPPYGRYGRTPTPTTPTHDKTTISSGIVLSPMQVSDVRPHFPESPAPIARSKRQEFFEEINDTTGYESKTMTKTYSCEFRSSAKHSDV